jgi:Domain of unknown function DUF11
LGKDNAFRLAAALVGLFFALALPSAAQASQDLAITQVPSAHVVEVGKTVDLRVTIANQGTGAVEAVFVNLYSLRGHGQGANNPYVSYTPSQGKCVDNSGPAYGYYYYGVVCELGPLAPGASAQIVGVVTVNESMNHFAALLPNATEGGYTDGNNSNNEAIDRIDASSPPTLTGSKKIKLRGLPTGCATQDFTLRAVGNVRGVKKMSASLYMGLDEEGVGHDWHKVATGSHLVAKVPVSRLTPELNASYELKVKAKLGGGRHLTATVTFQAC